MLIPRVSAEPLETTKYPREREKKHKEKPPTQPSSTRPMFRMEKKKTSYPVPQALIYIITLPQATSS